MKYSGGALLSSIIIDKYSNKKISTQIYMGLRAIILSEGLKAGERLPASRTLAQDLAVSRTTIVNAIERLISEGLLEARRGAGTYVSHIMREERPSPARPVQKGADCNGAPVQIADAMARALPALIARKRQPRRPHAFITGLPALDEFPMAQWCKLSAKNLRASRGELMDWHPGGLGRLRTAITSHINASRGIQCEAEQIFITGGAQHAFQLIGNMLLNHGDRVWLENPGAIGARNSFIAAGAKVIPVGVDTQGIMVETGLARAPAFKIAFVTPAHQQPLGVVMGLERRFALLQAAEDAGAWVVEDDYDSEFHYAGHPLPTLKSVDTTDRVIYVGTFSKSLFPALRIGFIIAPLRLVDAFAQSFNAFQPGIPTHAQAIIADFMDEGYFATHIRRMRGIYAERHRALVEYANQYLAKHFAIQPTKSGLHTVGYFRHEVDETGLSRVLREQGITALPLDRYCLAKIDKKGLTLGFGAVPTREIKKGVQIMADCFEICLQR